MKFKIEKASDSRVMETRDIRTIEDLLKLAEEYPTKEGKPENLVIWFFGYGRNSEPMITIYDDYIE